MTSHAPIPTRAVNLHWKERVRRASRRAMRLRRRGFLSVHRLDGALVDVLDPTGRVLSTVTTDTPEGRAFLLLLPTPNV